MRCYIWCLPHQLKLSHNAPSIFLFRRNYNDENWIQAEISKAPLRYCVFATNTARNEFFMRIFLSIDSSEFTVPKNSRIHVTSTMYSAQIKHTNSNKVFNTHTHNQEAKNWINKIWENCFQRDNGNLLLTTKTAVFVGRRLNSNKPKYAILIVAFD